MRQKPLLITVTCRAEEREALAAAFPHASADELPDAIAAWLRASLTSYLASQTQSPARRRSGAAEGTAHTLCYRAIEQRHREPHDRWGDGQQRVSAPLLSPNATKA